MATYKTPGVYIEEIALFPPSVAQVETAIPAFIGYTEKAVDNDGSTLTNKPTRITSMLEYETYFGKSQAETDLEITYAEEQDAANNTIKQNFTVAFNGAASRHIMYYALQAYFANGGGPCYIISIGAYKAAVGDALVKTDFDAGLAALAKEDEPTLIVFPEGQKMVEAEYYSLQNDALNQCGLLKDRFCILDVHHTGEGLVTSGNINAAITAFRGGITSASIKYGAAYFPNVKTILKYSYTAAQINVVHNVTGGTAPGAGPLNGQMLSAVAGINSSAYNKLKQAIDQYPIVLPPSSLIAGVYAAVDSSRGVWKAPANVGLNVVTNVTCKITDDIQNGLNVDTTSGKSVNAIRPFTGKGTLVWGARTLTGNDNEWRYVSVRRFFNMVEESVKKATYQFVFEPNDANTWVKVRAMIENYLTVLWRQGALAGAKPEHAFYVKVGLNITMTAQDILEGYMNVEIGMAAVRPAEFIVLKFSHKMQES
ncbi:phage tail sheath family protein [Ferruginibacter sp.]|nr:phage tail sheath family protein [Ferruginibacter sp.]